ncbi:SDR family NAD(P)-dependent oxidoreductase [Niastella sp. OAS944]|uniref:SDR family NAD(P)-dependent oxidoreductase n=1 Tax=Niastella sp. OAS944 TaxID=2664089 RepID=UPI003489403A|nr:NAD(P)-dependent dehydrogenase (short-subunit alcohol dehydrogenase family) [Chitinophagaceae bacterium OAS944]
MARIFITGSADGLGFLAARELINEGHQVVLHARNAQRTAETKRKLPQAEAVLTADLQSIEETNQLAATANALGTFDAVIHNAGVYQAAPQLIFAVNTLAPYILTSLINKPKRLIYLSSGMHMQGRPNFENFENGRISYSDSKLHVLMLSIAVARQWPGVYSNTVNPGWVPTKMGGHGAPDDLQKGYETQVWLATSNDDKATVSGRYFHHKKERPYNSTANDVKLQEELLHLCEKMTGVAFPNAL